MKISEAYPSKYIRSEDIGERSIQLVISHLDMEDMRGGDEKPVLYFVKTKKGLVLNKTNATTIAKAYGDDTDNWRGKTVIVFTAVTDFGGRDTLGIRIRIPKHVAAKHEDKISSGPLPALQESENPAPADLDGLEF